MSFFKKYWHRLFSRNVQKSNTEQFIANDNSEIIDLSLRKENKDSEMFDFTVFDLPSGTKPAVLMKEFRKFGEIEAIKLFKTVAFIKYKDSSAAAEALSTTSKSFRRCNHWDQYLYKDQIGKPEIMKLDRDCLLEIFDRLELNDQINFAKSNEMFMSLYKRKKYSTINLDQKEFKNKETLKNFLSLFALDVETLVTNETSTQSDYQSNTEATRLPYKCLKMISKSCTNLNTVKFYGKTLMEIDVYYLLKMTKLRDLSLVGCDMESFPKIFLELRDHLDTGLNLCLDYLFKRLKNLSKLDLSFSQNFSDYALLAFLRQHPKVTYVNISGCNQIGKDFSLKAIQILKKQTKRSERCEIVTTLEKDEEILDLIQDEPRMFIRFE